MRFNEKLQVLVHNKWSRFGLVSVAGLTLVGATAVGAHASFAPTNQPVHHIAKTKSSQVKIKASSHIKHSSSTSATSVSSSQATSVSAPEPTSDASQVTTATSVAESQPQATPDTTPVAEPTPETTPAPTPAPVADTSGFNMLGQHFPIGSFAGTGQVPADNMVYRWASDSRWFLIEQAGQAGQIVQGVGMGAPITVDGHTYHVTDIQHGIPNNGDAGRYYLAHINQHAIGFQTCDTYGILSLWFAD